MEYSQEQKAWSVIWYGVSVSSTFARREYRKKFGLNGTLSSSMGIMRPFLAVGSSLDVLLENASENLLF